MQAPLALLCHAVLSAQNLFLFGVYSEMISVALHSAFVEFCVFSTAQLVAIKTECVMIVNTIFNLIEILVRASASLRCVYRAF